VSNAQYEPVQLLDLDIGVGQDLHIRNEGNGVGGWLQSAATHVQDNGCNRTL
jgi:hypothetical protein